MEMLHSGLGLRKKTHEQVARTPMALTFAPSVSHNPHLLSPGSVGWII